MKHSSIPTPNTVAIDVRIDSGPVFHVGELEIEGLSRYPSELVRNYRTQRPGDRYSIAELDQFVRRLNGTGYFASVHAAIDADPAHADDAPVRVSVIEAPPKKLEMGSDTRRTRRFAPTPATATSTSTARRCK